VHFPIYRTPAHKRLTSLWLCIQTWLVVWKIIFDFRFNMTLLIVFIHCAATLYTRSLIYHNEFTWHFTLTPFNGFRWCHFSYIVFKLMWKTFDKFIIDVMMNIIIFCINWYLKEWKKWQVLNVCDLPYCLEWQREKKNLLASTYFCSLHYLFLNLFCLWIASNEVWKLFLLSSSLALALMFFFLWTCLSVCAVRNFF
jgi:hypothetical protein